MRALHVFPLLNPELASGSDYYQFMLTRELVRLGVEIDVYTTWSGHLELRSAFGIGWPADFATGSSLVDSVRVHRFATASLSPALGHALSRAILRRWQREAERDGCALGSAEETVEVMHRRARARPMLYDYLALRGRGPHTPRLLAAAR